MYVDENALQPSQMTLSWSMDQVVVANRISAELHELAKRGDKEACISYLVNELRSYGLNAHTQAYAYYVPGSDEPLRGVNIYARSHTPQIDGREALLLAASWRSHWQGNATSDEMELPFVPDDGQRRAINVRGISLLLALAKHTTSIPFWSKDLMFVISDGFLDGMQAWATQYFGLEQPNLDAEPILCTGAQIWNALALDYPADSFSSFAFLFEGRDGLLPNLDTVNTISNIARSDLLSPAVELHGLSTKGPLRFLRANALPSWVPVAWIERKWLGYNGVDRFLVGWRNILAQLRLQLAGHPSGIHGVLLPFHVDGVTIFGEPASGPYGFIELGRISESTMRSFSNLLERLHHSQFFYLLASPWRFVQIGVFLFVPLFLAAALTLKGIAVWSQLGSLRQKQRNALRRQYTKSVPLLAEPTYDEFAQLCNDEEQRARFRSHDRPVVMVLLLMGVCHGIGGVILALLTRTPIDCAVAHGLGSCRPLLWILLCSLLSPVIMACYARFWKGATLLSLAMCLHAFTLLNAGMVISVLATLNFAQATTMALLLCATLYPVCVLHDRSFFRSAWYLLQGISLVLVSPPILTIAATFLPRAWLSGLDVEHILRAALWDFHVLRTSMLHILCLGYAPMILQGATACLLYSLS